MGLTAFFGFLIFILGCHSGNCCPIHSLNEQIFAEIIKTRLGQQKDTISFFTEIDCIGKEACEKGLDLSCYQICGTNQVCYTAFPLWEGKESGEEMLFLLFVWPSEQEVINRGEIDSRYKTNIHSHPLSCAYTVLLGEITERIFERIDLSDKRIRFCERQLVHAGEKAVDLNQEPFIHQLLFEGGERKTAISLHVYGCSSRERLSRIFTENREEHVFSEACIVN